MLHVSFIRECPLKWIFFSVAALAFWNTIVPKMWLAPTLLIFQTALKTQLFSQTWNQEIKDAHGKVVMDVIVFLASLYVYYNDSFFLKLFF